MHLLAVFRTQKRWRAGLQIFPESSNTAFSWASPTSHSSHRPTGSRKSKRDPHHALEIRRRPRRPTEVDMKRMLAALVVATAALGCSAPALAQQEGGGTAALQELLKKDIPQE